MRIFSQNYEVELVQVKSVLSLANIAFLRHMFILCCHSVLGLSLVKTHC